MSSLPYETMNRVSDVLDNVCCSLPFKTKKLVKICHEAFELTLDHSSSVHQWQVKIGFGSVILVNF